ncbi:hypothetical protein KZZ52_33675 [Dactylosporangium sp. AC04546]|uniref:hypothetical protein n=1 Tax=Dactylosporangium sp. AC04546 TaxID=2862460 RepID=UPI001EDFA747|nr:hypothetical protein [Dactylosporangium sp. AC04546]WVK78926.1 hypothetical protein KZZ52_33675 [Dactylosporangium sp. AC04546]
MQVVAERSGRRRWWEARPRSRAGTVALLTSIVLVGCGISGPGDRVVGVRSPARIGSLVWRVDGTMFYLRSEGYDEPTTLRRRAPDGREADVDMRPASGCTAERYGLHPTASGVGFLQYCLADDGTVDTTLFVLDASSDVVTELITVDLPPGDVDGIAWLDDGVAVLGRGYQCRLLGALDPGTRKVGPEIVRIDGKDVGIAGPFDLPNHNSCLPSPTVSAPVRGSGPALFYVVMQTAWDVLRVAVVATDHTVSAITPEFHEVFGYDASVDAVVIAGSQGGSRGLWYVDRRNGKTCQLAGGDWFNASLSPSGDRVAAVYQGDGGSSIRTLPLRC